MEQSTLINKPSTNKSSDPNTSGNNKTKKEVRNNANSSGRS